MQLIISPELRAHLAKRFHAKTKKGFIKMIAIILVGLVVISVLGFDIRAAIEHPQTQENFSFLGQFIADVWNTYLAGIWAVVWNVIGPIFDMIWRGIENFQWSDFNTDAGDFVNNSPSIQL